MNHAAFDPLGFPHAYECEVLLGLPGEGPAPLAFARPSQATHSEGVVISVVPAVGERWLGNFQYGNEGASGVFAFPNPDVLCVVARGQGYLVNADRPSVFDLVEANPIKQVLSVPERELVVFVDYTMMVAYGTDGLAWRTGHLSWDGLRITSIGSLSIDGFAWDAPAGKEVRFSVNALTGSHTGGSSPEAEARKSGPFERGA